MIEIGFMQGRLSPLIDGKIQSFPWSNWRQEIGEARSLGFQQMEWTLDQADLYENPLLTSIGQTEISNIINSGFSIPSLTGDCFMQAPFWKAAGDQQAALKEDFRQICQACSRVGIGLIVIPLVDNGSVDTAEQNEILVDFLRAESLTLEKLGLKVCFESDYDAAALARFIAQFDSTLFGINYDIGNSAALGYDPQVELAAYGARVVNVHIKDRQLGGTTVALGTGAADFPTVFECLNRIHYAGNFILQTARATDDRHGEVLVGFKEQSLNWLRASGY